MSLVIVNTLVKMDNAASVRRGNYGLCTRSGAPREDDRYQWRSRENPRSGAAREAHSHRHGTLTPSPRLLQNSPRYGEDSESSDSGSSDNEHKNSKVKQICNTCSSILKKRQICNTCNGIIKKRQFCNTCGCIIKKSWLCNTCSYIIEKGKKHVLTNNPCSCITEKGTKLTLTNKPCSCKTHKGTKNVVTSNTHSSTLTYVIIIPVIILVVAFVIHSLLLGSNDLSLEERKSQLQDRFREIRKQFPTQNDDVWLTLLAGIKKVEEDPSQPSTFLLLHEGEDETPKCLAVKTSKAATEFLKATDPSPLKLQGEELGANDSLINDHGILISEQKENITNHRAMIVFNLHKIPASVAQSFHYFCDEYNPVVQRAVYFFTMTVSKRLHNNPTYVAESELKKLWQEQLQTDKLQPLIVRLTTSVMVIKPEKRFVSSCDSKV